MTCCTKFVSHISYIDNCIVLSFEDKKNKLDSVKLYRMRYILEENDVIKKSIVLKYKLY